MGHRVTQVSPSGDNEACGQRFTIGLKDELKDEHFSATGKSGKLEVSSLNYWRDT